MVVTGTEQRVYGTLVKKEVFNNCVFMMDLTESVSGTQVTYIKTTLKSLATLIFADEKQHKIHVFQYLLDVFNQTLNCSSEAEVHAAIDKCTSYGGFSEHHLGAIYYTVNKLLIETEEQFNNWTLILFGNENSYLTQLLAPYGNGTVIDIPLLKIQINDIKAFYIQIWSYTNSIQPYDMRNFLPGIDKALGFEIDQRPSAQLLYDEINNTFK